jgi:hypothetical protein
MDISSWFNSSDFKNKEDIMNWYTCNAPMLDQRFQQTLFLSRDYETWLDRVVPVLHDPWRLGTDIVLLAFSHLTTMIGLHLDIVESY